MMLYIEIGIIGIIIILQIVVFVDVFKKIKKLQNFFPNNTQSIKVREFDIPRRILKETDEFLSFIANINSKADDSLWQEEETEKVEVLVTDYALQNQHKEFNEILKSTNAYLVKNKGAAADFNILRDTCERYIERLDNSIGNLISVPLYIGLAGTFVGIIIGLSGIDFASTGGAISPSSIDSLLTGVIIAMIASLIGLVLTVINTAFTYKNAIYQNDTSKNLYYDFLQRELLPALNVGMAGSISSFKGVLSNFIQKFGHNISEYHDTAALLNDNLTKQQFVLQEINKLSLTKTAKTIATTFADLKNASDEINQFYNYQKSLNKNVTEAEKVVQGLNTTLDKFQNFNSNLEAISQNVHSGITLQKQFKDSLELHFPTIDDHRKVWRKQVDEINMDIKGAYKELTNYFQLSNQQITQFLSSNENSFSSQYDVKKGIQLFVANSKIQNTQFKNLEDQMTAIRTDLHGSHTATLELNKDLVEAIKSLTVKISRLEPSI